MSENATTARTPSSRLGEIGHELNNLLMGIHGSAAEVAHATPAARAATDRIVLAAERCSLLADELIHASLIAPASASDAAERAGARVALVVEDEPIVGALAAQMLERCGYRVVTAADGEEALDVLEDLRRPLALILTDIVMPRMNGVAVAEAARRLRPGLAVVLMSGYTEERFADQVAAGAIFLHKPFTLEQLEVAIDAALAVTGARSSAAEQPAGQISLTPRERGVLTLLAEGSTNDQAAARLGIAPDTVQSHVHHAMRKLGAESRTHAVASAIRLSLIG